MLLVLVASLLPVLAILWLLLEYRSSTVEQAREQLSLKAERSASELGDRIAGTGQMLFGLARAPILSSGNRAACSQFLVEVLREHPQYTGILTIDPEGELQCDSLQTGRHLNVRDRSYFKRASQVSQLIVEPAIGRLSGKPVLQIAYPVRKPDGTLQSILLASLDMAVFGQKVVSTMPHERSNFQIWAPDGTIVMDNPGRNASLLSSTPAHRTFMLSGSDKETAVLGEGKDARIWSKASVRHESDTLLILAVSVPADDLQHDTEQRFQRAIISLVGLAIITVLAAMLMGELSIRKQAGRLIRAVASLDEGDFSAHIGRPYPRGELGQVMQAIDRLASSLGRQRQEIERNTEALERQASVDELTGLANRHRLIERLNLTLDAAQRNERLAGIIMLDLDRFKIVNDTMGHSQGDMLLVETAKRLQGCVRDGDTVARLGGDEFVVLLADVASIDDLTPLAEKILKALAIPIESSGKVFDVSASLGVAIFPQDGTNSGELLQHADTAMYRAKGSGGNSLSFFSHDMRQALLSRLQIEAGLRRALEAGEFRLYYQPIVATASGRVISVEALIRWQDPEKGLVPPIEFIPVAEETGMIVPIGNWVMREAMRQAKEWQDQGLDLSVAINLSARQFNAQSLDEIVAQLLAETGCPPQRVQLEITESLIMEHIEHALATMHRLTSLGVQLMIDDFGTGYSSLSQLKRFPVSTLKIDASFVRDIEHDPNDETLVDAIIALAKKLGLRTVAEGVENEAQVRYLTTLGCDRLQGYYFARPAPADRLIEFLAQRGEYQPGSPTSA